MCGYVHCVGLEPKYDLTPPSSQAMVTRGGVWGRGGARGMSLSFVLFLVLLRLEHPAGWICAHYKSYYYYYYYLSGCRALCPYHVCFKPPGWSAFIVYELNRFPVFVQCGSLQFQAFYVQSSRLCTFYISQIMISNLNKLAEKLSHL